MMSWYDHIVSIYQHCLAVIIVRALEGLRLTQVLFIGSSISEVQEREYSIPMTLYSRVQSGAFMHGIHGTPCISTTGTDKPPYCLRVSISVGLS